jgi:hypothetical protein
VPFEKGPVAHSDGDVLCHSLVDAILGAAGAGDIGRHFPNTDAAWKDAPGLDLLARSLEIVRRLGWSVANADITIVLERPKLAGTCRRSRSGWQPRCVFPRLRQRQGQDERRRGCGRSWRCDRRARGGDAGRRR